MRTAVKTVALMSLGIPLATMPAVAQDDEGELTPVVITGSNIPTVELEGPSPIVRIDREEMPRDRAALIRAAAGLSALFLDYRNVLSDLEINPLIVLGDGEGVRAVDVRPVERVTKQ